MREGGEPGAARLSSRELNVSFFNCDSESTWGAGLGQRAGRRAQADHWDLSQSSARGLPSLPVLGGRGRLWGNKQHSFTWLFHTPLYSWSPSLTCHLSQATLATSLAGLCQFRAARWGSGWLCRASSHSPNTVHADWLKTLKCQSVGMNIHMNQGLTLFGDLSTSRDWLLWGLSFCLYSRAQFFWGFDSRTSL